MKIEIDTDGTGEGTVVKFNGVVQPDLIEMNFSIRAGRAAKMQLVRMDEKTHVTRPESFYNQDFEKFNTTADATQQPLIGSRVKKI